jgi:carboxyvinyl-carboxyphosphonate phosphorylmutase
MSARLAESVGYEIGMFAGSIASATVLGAPDLIVVTLSEFADQLRRITRASDLSMMVDADHGYGNALNVMRTVEELETAGVSALTIEDTILPRQFGGESGLVSVPEMLGKLKAAVEARQDPSLVIIGRSEAVSYGGVPEMVERLRAYRETGVDAIFLVGVTKPEELDAAHRVSGLPLLLGAAPGSLGDRDFLASKGVRIALQGHAPYYVGVRAVYDAYKHLRKGGSPDDLAPRAASGDVLSAAQHKDDYDRWLKEFLS